MKNLTIEQSVMAIFGMCSDVTRLTARGIPYWYFNPKRSEDARVIKYVFKKNNISAHLHKTRYYDCFGTKRQIVRVHASDLNDNQEFKNFFEYVHNRKENLSSDTLADTANTKMFALWSRAKKMKLIESVAGKVK